MKILHITPHLGGGVGTVLRGYLTYCSEQKNMEETHRVVALDSISLDAKEFLSKIGCDWIDEAFQNFFAIDEIVAMSDVVVIHWWNHPQLQYFLMTHSMPESRVLIWAHISGSHSPNNFNPFILQFPDKLIFTTPLSFNVSDIQSLPLERQKKFGWIWSTAGVEKLQERASEAINHSGVRDKVIGYTGNLDYTKMNEGFLSACKSIHEANLRFIVIGPLTSQFESDLDNLGNDNRFNITGFIPEADKLNLMRSFDIFGYPLARHHYGTCDQAIQEAMALGVPPIVLNNPMESYMVKHGETGLVARDLNEYGFFISQLLNDEPLRLRLSGASRKFAHRAYSVKNMARKWSFEFKQLLKIRKSKKQCLASLLSQKLEPHRVFVESLGSHAGVFKAHLAVGGGDIFVDKTQAEAQIKCLRSYSNWSSPTKSTASHYYSFFPDDQLLREWSALTLEKAIL